MAVPFRHALIITAACAFALPCFADEIRLKDGKKLYGVIVAYEENMFKVKTDFGYVLVEKDKIASIVPTTPAGPPPDPKAQPAKNGTDTAKTDEKAAAKTESSAPGTETTPAIANVSAKTVAPGQGGKSDKAAPRVSSAAVKPALPPSSSAAEVTAPALKGTPVAVNAGPAASATQTTAPPKPEVPAVREEVLGNVYVNHTHGFKMYKAPSWELIEGAQNALPDAVAAMGTSNESTLIVVGREKTKEPLETAAASVEKRLHEVYEGYRRTSQRKTTVAGSPAVEYRYIGRADEHDWSGTLVVIARGADIFTVLGMTYADSDLIQIQENVISKAVSSLSFDVK